MRLVLPLLSLFAWVTWSFPISFEDYGHDQVPIFTTAIIFRIVLNNEDSANSYNLTAYSTSCCLSIDINDTDCEIMHIDTIYSVFLGTANSTNATVTIIFPYRNLYSRYRIGNCSFIIASSDHDGMEFGLTIPFNTTPDDNYTCSTVDRDPDRECRPVDCAVKYKGFRNFYRNATGKCEEVVPCDTRGEDGFTHIGYYDWENNLCIKYKWFEDDNYLNHVESDAIPTTIDPSASSSYYIDLQPESLIGKVNSSEKINCNNGVMVGGIYCQCDPGWVSSGIDKNNPLIFNWCDVQDSVSEAAALSPPINLTPVQETISIIFLAIANFVLTAVWFFLLIKVIYPILPKGVKNCIDTVHSVIPKFKKSK